MELGTARFLGVALGLPGILLYFRCAWGFAVVGSGTPAPIDPPKTLVVAGPYRYMRNPMYVGVLLILLGEALFFESAGLLLYTAFMFALFQLFIVLYEEPTLWRRFGDSYERYRSRVPRWLPRKFWCHLASVALLVYGAGCLAHILNLAGVLPIQQMPNAVHAAIMLFAGYSGLGFIANSRNVVFKNVADKLMYGLITVHLNLSALLHAYSILFHTNAWIALFPRWYSYVAVVYLVAFGYYSFNLRRRFLGEKIN